MPEVKQSSSSLVMEDMTTVGTLAEKLAIPVSKLIGELIKNGVMATVNEKIDIDTAQIIVDELGLDIRLVRQAETEAAPVERHKAPKSDKAKPRPPVVAVMGHVDHGKTSLLDAIRGASVVKDEAGGITQHISAYQIKHGDRSITFLDTPGHEAFAAIRQHGAMLTDIVVIVIAADDGIKPQTLEAIRYAKQAGVKMIVAVNKIDKTGADINRIKQQLADNDLLIEEWGGDTVLVPVSAKTKEGVDDLLNMILLVSDVEELTAEDEGPADGLIIEAHIEKGRGPVAHALVVSGRLKKSDYIVAGSSYGKIRNLETTDGQPLSEATPSTPVAITGFKALPEFGDEFKVLATEREAKAQAALATRQAASGSRMSIGSADLIRLMNRDRSVQELNVIIKADVQGSLTSVIDSIKALDTDEVAIRIVGSGIGAINENDLHLAHSSGAIIYGFSVNLPPSSRSQASRDKITVKLFDVIYELIDDVKNELSELLSPEIVETELGRLIVRGIFKTTKTEVICGGEVTKGKLTVPSLARVFRDNEQLAEVEITNLKKGPADAKEILEGEMCGLSLKTTKRLVLNEGDRIEAFTREAVSRSL